MTAREVEVVVARHFKPRVNVIVPNASWGVGLHECDLLILSGNGYATEVEIKVTKHDLLRDKLKQHQHKSSRIKNLYFAYPAEMDAPEIRAEIPAHAGIIIVHDRVGVRERWMEVVRKPVANKLAGKWSEYERTQLLRLGYLRMWSMRNA